MNDTKKLIANMGGPTKVAEICSITSQAVSQWNGIPAKHVIKLEKETGVDRTKLNPEFYPPHPKTKAA